MINGDVVRELRNCFNLTQGEFAEKLGVSESLLSLWETNKRKVQGSARVLLNIYFNALFELYVTPNGPGPNCESLGITRKIANKMSPPLKHGALLRKIYGA